MRLLRTRQRLSGFGVGKSQIDAPVGNWEELKGVWLEEIDIDGSTTQIRSRPMAQRRRGEGERVRLEVTKQSGKIIYT